MRASIRLASLALALTAIPAIAFAADLPVKAPRLAALSVTSDGWYVGAISEAVVQQSDVSGNNLFASSLVNGNLKAAGGAIGVSAGYIRSNCLYGTWCRVQVAGLYQNITAGEVNGSVASRWSATQEVDLGVEVFSAITSVIGNVGVSFPTFTPSLPGNVLVAGAPRQYIGVGLREAGISGNFFSVGGSTVSVAWMVKSGYVWQGLAANGVPNGTAIDAYAWVAFPNKGFTVTNAFASTGGPMLAASVQQGNQYGLGLSVGFVAGSSGLVAGR